MHARGQDGVKQVRGRMSEGLRGMQRTGAGRHTGKGEAWALMRGAMTHGMVSVNNDDDGTSWSSDTDPTPPFIWPPPFGVLDLSRGHIWQGGCVDCRPSKYCTRFGFWEIWCSHIIIHAAGSHRILGLCYSSLSDWVCVWFALWGKKSGKCENVEMVKCPICEEKRGKE